MKILAFTLLAAFPVNQATAQTVVPPAQLDCTIASFENGPISYQPPKVGSRIRLDLSQPTLSGTFVFEDGTHLITIQEQRLRRVQDGYQTIRYAAQGPMNRISQLTVRHHPGQPVEWSASIEDLYNSDWWGWHLSKTHLHCHP